MKEKLVVLVVLSLLLSACTVPGLEGGVNVDSTYVMVTTTPVPGTPAAQDTPVNRGPVAGYEGFCANTEPVVFGPDGSPIESLPSEAPCPPGTYTVMNPWRDAAAKGDTLRFGNWADALTYIKTWKGGSIWYEPSTSAGQQPAATPAPSTDGQVSLDWTNWCSGTSPLVFTGGGILNAGDLVSLVPPCNGGTVAMIEPWRPGCSAPHANNPNCNVGKAWVASDWSTATSWLVQGNWPEGSLWYRPTEQLDEGTVVATCVRALVVPGTAINTVNGQDLCK